MAGLMPSAVDTTNIDLCSNLCTQFDIAASKTGLIAHHLTIAGQRICLQFAGPDLVDRILPALLHLATDENGAVDGPPDLTIHIWDAASTGTDAPQMPWSHDQFGARREIQGANTANFRVAYDLFCGVLSFVSLKQGTAYWWISDRDRLPWYESAAPLREVLQAWFEHCGGIFIHAAALGTDDGAVLLVGPGGTGKTTTALACTSANLRLLGEDYCLLTEFDHTGLQVHSLYSSAKLTEQSMDMLPHLAPLVVNPDRQDADAKAVLFLSPTMPIQKSAKLRAIVLPVRSNIQDPQISPAKAKDALLALAPSTILQLSGMSQAGMSMMKHAAQSVPAYRLDVGTQPQDAADLLFQLVTSTP